MSVEGRFLRLSLAENGVSRGGKLVTIAALVSEHASGINLRELSWFGGGCPRQTGRRRPPEDRPNVTGPPNGEEMGNDGRKFRRRKNSRAWRIWQEGN